MSEEAKREKSLRIIENLKHSKEFAQAKSIMVYVSKEDEVDTTSLIGDALGMGKQVFVPSSDMRRKSLMPCEITSLDELVEGCFGIKEPAVRNVKRLNRTEIDLAIVPGRAFDRECNRLGRGGGYFDCFLREWKSIGKKIGLAFSEQIVRQVPTNSQDVKMDRVITESYVIRGKM